MKYHPIYFLLFQRYTRWAFLLCILPLPALFSQDFYQTYKNEFLTPLENVQKTQTKDDDKLFFQEQVKKINRYKPAGLQRFIAKQIINLTEKDPILQRECLEIGLLLAQKNWIRGKEKIELLKNLSKIAESYQNSLNYNLKKEKNDVYELAFRIEQETLDEYIFLLKPDEAKTWLLRWSLASKYVKNAKAVKNFDQDSILYEAKIKNIKKLSASLANYHNQKTNSAYQKNLAMDSLVYLISPGSALAFLNKENMPNEFKMILAFYQYLNRNTPKSPAPYFLSEQDLVLPPSLLFECLTNIEEIQSSAAFAKEQFEKEDYTFLHHARDLALEIITKNPDKSSYDEKDLVDFFNWIDNVVKNESDETQLLFSYQIKPILTEASASSQEQANKDSLVKALAALDTKITSLEKKLKIYKFRYPAPPPNEESEKEKQWKAKTQQERDRLIDDLYNRFMAATDFQGNRNDRRRVGLDFNAKYLSIGIYNRQLKNFTIPDAIPIKKVTIRNSSFPNLSFLNGMPVESIDISWSRIKDISSLKNLKTLQALWLTGTQVDNLADLKDLSLTRLYIDHTAVSDLSPIQSMPLTELSIEKTNVSLLNPLAYMPLVNLNANECKNIKTLEPLRNTDLRILRINGCEQVRTLEPLTKLPLTELYIEETGISDLSYIARCGLTKLSFVKCPNIRNINDIALMDLNYLGINSHQFIPIIIRFGYNLTSLRIVKTNITDLSALKYFEALETLDVSESTMLKDLRSLKNLSISTLNVDNCKQLRSFAGLNGLNVKNLYANGTIIQDLSTLANSTVEKIEMRNSELITLKGLQTLTAIKDLDLRASAKLRDINDAEKTLIERFLLRGARPQSVEALSKMPNLRNCDIQY